MAVEPFLPFSLSSTDANVLRLMPTCYDFSRFQNEVIGLFALNAVS